MSICFSGSSSLCFILFCCYLVCYYAQLIDWLIDWLMYRVYVSVTLGNQWLMDSCLSAFTFPSLCLFWSLGAPQNAAKWTWRHCIRLDEFPSSLRILLISVFPGRPGWWYAWYPSRATVKMPRALRMAIGNCSQGASAGTRHQSTRGSTGHCLTLTTETDSWAFPVFQHDDAPCLTHSTIDLRFQTS